MTPEALTRALGGSWWGKSGLAHCPVPGHGRNRGDRNPSLSISKGDHQSLILFCHAGCSQIDVLRAIAKLENAPPGRTMPDNPRKTSQGSSSACKTVDWRAAWDEAVPIANTPAQTYLSEARRVVTPNEIQWPPADAVRYHPNAPFNEAGDWRVPGLLAAVRDASGTITGVQVTGLRSDGSAKILARKKRHNFGHFKGGAVRLGPVKSGRRSAALAVAEGLETALGFARLSGYSCWASLGVHLASFAPPMAIDELVIAADHDTPGLKSARRLAERCGAIALVEIRHPEREGADWADVCAAQRDDA